MSQPSRVQPAWFPYLDLACAAWAGGLWYAFPRIGPWPLVVGLAPWVARWVLSGRLTRRTAFDLPLALFVLTAAISVWAAYDRPVAWSKFWLIVGGVLLFYALSNAQGLGEVRGWLLAIFGAGVALYFLVTHDWDVYPAKIAALTRLGRALQAPLPTLPGHRLHPNVAGGIMAMMLPFSAAVVASSWQTVNGAGRPRRITAWLPLTAALGTVAISLAGLVMATSRGAWVALAGAGVLAAMWALAGLTGRGQTRRRAWVFLGLLAASVALILGVALAWPAGIVGAIGALPGENTADGRLYLLRNTFTLVRDYPIVGAGLGGFQMLYSTYVLLLHVGYTVHSHSLFLDVAVEQGLVALAILGWTGLLFAGRVFRGLLGAVGRDEGRLLAAAFLSLAIVLIHGLVDDALYGSRAVLLLFVPLAFAVPVPLALAVPVPRAKPYLARRCLAVLVPAGLVLLMLAGLIWRGPVASLIASNLGAVRQSQAELGEYRWPDWPIQDEVRRAVDLSGPVAMYERALALDPGNATANRRLGMIELSLGEYGDALAHLEAAYQEEPESETTRQLLGEAYLANGRLEEGRDLWAMVSDGQSQLDARVWWYGHIGDAGRAATMKEAVGER